MKSLYRTAFVLLLACSGTASLWGADLARARALYEKTQYNDALALLDIRSSSDPELLLLGAKALYGKSEFKKAVETLQRAAGLAPKSSEIQHWLGKAFGRLAESSNFLSAPGHASNCRKAFERAVELDGRNLLAMNDLLEYYLEAPGFLGGGIEKAQALAQRIAPLSTAEYHFALAKLAEKRKDAKTAEQEYRKAAEAEPNESGRLIDLASFLARQGRLAESDRVFQDAQRLSPSAPNFIFARASTLIETRRDPREAKRLLELYLKASLTPDDPPRDEARKMLAKLGGA
jgi:Flp pilus assembly protein TadD